jgi:signal transduction histidine kinase/ActR/RegA family two-component response regulator
MGSAGENSGNSAAESGASKLKSQTIWLVIALIAGLLSLLLPSIGNAIDGTLGNNGGQILPPLLVLAIGFVVRFLSPGDTTGETSTEESLPRQLLDASIAPVAQLSKSGRLVAVNSPWRHTLQGMDVDAVFADHLIPASQAAFAKGMHDAVIDGNWLGQLQMNGGAKTGTAYTFHLRHLPATPQRPAVFLLQVDATGSKSTATQLAPLELAVVGVDKDNRVSAINEEGKRFFPDAEVGVQASGVLPKELANPLTDESNSIVLAIKLQTVPQIRTWILQEPGNSARTILAEDVSDEVAIRQQASFLGSCCETVGEACDRLATIHPDELNEAVTVTLAATRARFQADAVVVARRQDQALSLHLNCSDRGPIPEELFSLSDDGRLIEQLVAGEIVKLKEKLPAPLPQHLNAWCIPSRIGGELVGAMIIVLPEGHTFPDKMRAIASIIALMLSATLDRRRRDAVIDDLQNQLRQSQRLETVGILAGGIAHDFSNILTPITGFLQFAMQDLEKDSQTYADLEHVCEGVERARNLIRQILSFSRGSETGRSIINPADVVRSTIKLIRGPLPTTISLSSDLQPNHLVDADPGQIHQVVLNIATNAYQAMRLTGGQLSVKLDRRTLEREHPDLQTGMPPGDYVCIAIGDNGPGMPKEVADHIFEPFFTTKAEGEGTGLGLVVVSGIVISHGGGIALTTAPGEGTEFRVYLPAVTDDSQPTVIADSQQVKKEKEPKLGYKVLFCDDETGITNLARRRLEARGMTVVACLHATDALAAFQEAPETFDALVTDQTMPDMTGTELIEAVHKTRPELPVILASGYSPTFSGLDMEDDAVCAQFGARRFLRKPYMMDDLAKTIDEVVKET